MSNTTNTPAASVAANNCTILPDGSAFAVASFPLPKDHWLYAPREYDVDAENPKELPSPILTHALRAEVVSAIRYAIRGATMCGKETDFDPDALVQNAVYALCGPYGSAALAAPAQAATAKQSPHPEYDKGFSDGWNQCEARQAAAPAQAGEYPELPPLQVRYDGLGRMTTLGYGASQMRDYADATCAARGAANGGNK